MSLRRQNIAKKAEANTDSVEPNYGLYEQLGPPSRDSHIYPAPPIPTEAERTEVEIIEEILEPPSPPFAQGRISCRIRAMFAGDRPTPRVTVAVRRVPPRTPVPPTSEGVVPYLESPGPAKKDPPKEKRLSTITAPTSVRQGCRYPWEPKRRPPPVPLPEIQQSPQTPPPIIFPRFKLSPREKEDVIQDGMDLYEPVSSYFDDFYGPFSDQASGGCPVNPQKEITGSSSLSHERSGLVKNISAWKQYPPLGKILCFQPDSGEIIGEDALSEYPPPPTRAPPSPPISHPVNKVTDSWFSDSEGEEEEEDSFYAPCSKRNKNEAAR
ncbi:hypothetical protein L873DRAFT_233661 [Choiromyces venosus 120613-1]|uniref:Uncharacterized protein n=1 Tax=Choiromyces venosus 120613-1 TaxID=1336337 RepID=A0A3N4KBN5_9PEZI|nr:hypothetical protein L873DRAFT_233661 [Choiromyces venosus 120613-1]